MNTVQCLHDKTQGSASRPAAFSVGWSQAIFAMSLRHYTITGISAFPKFALWDLVFAKELHQYLFFPTTRHPQGIFAFMKRGKVKIVLSVCFAEAVGIPARRGPPPSFFLGTTHSIPASSCHRSELSLWASVSSQCIPCIHQQDMT